METPLSIRHGIRVLTDALYTVEQVPLAGREQISQNKLLKAVLLLVSLTTLFPQTSPYRHTLKGILIHSGLMIIIKKKKTKKN